MAIIVLKSWLSLCAYLTFFFKKKVYIYIYIYIYIYMFIHIHIK